MQNLSADSRSANEPPAAIGRQRWMRFALLVLLVQTTLFWEGCRSSTTVLSVGFAGPALSIGYDGDRPLSSEVVGSSAVCLIANLLAIVAVVLLVAYAPPRWTNWLTRGLLLVSAAIVTMVFNSVLFFPWLWVNAAVMPVLWVTEALFGSSQENNYGPLGAMSRLYYLVCVGAIAGVMWLVRAIIRRYFFVAADRWQFSLAGLLALMVIFGTGIGMLLRLLVG